MSPPIARRVADLLTLSGYLGPWLCFGSGRRSIHRHAIFLGTKVSVFREQRLRVEYTSKCLTSGHKVPHLQLLSVQHGGARCRNTHVPIFILFLFSHLSHSVNSEALGYVFFSSSMVESNASKPFWLHMVILFNCFPVPSIFRPPIGTKGTWNKGDANHPRLEGWPVIAYRSCVGKNRL